MFQNSKKGSVQKKLFFLVITIVAINLAEQMMTLEKIPTQEFSLENFSFHTWLNRFLYLETSIR